MVNTRNFIYNSNPSGTLEYWNAGIMGLKAEIGLIQI
jgi:hypothetical protein